MIEYRVMAGIKRDYSNMITEIINQTGSKVVYDDFNNTYSTSRYTARKTWSIPTNKKYICVIQDDCELSNNFVEITNTIVKLIPNDVMFGLFDHNIKELVDEPYIQRSRIFGQCIIMPKDMVNSWLNWDINTLPEYFPWDDFSIGCFAYKHHIPILTTSPNLVQHHGWNNSSVGLNSRKKISKIFDKNPTKDFNYLNVADMIGSPQSNWKAEAEWYKKKLGLK